jgi:hypothetical protein
MVRNGLPAIAAGVALALAGCGGGGDAEGPALGQANGNLSLAVTDAPVDGANKVVIRFTAIEIKREGQNPQTIDIPDREIDVLALRDGRSTALLDQQSVAAGRYEWVRLLINVQANAQDGSYVELGDGRIVPLVIPSGLETGLKLVRGFTVAQGGATSLTVDFDLRSSLHAPPGQAPNMLFRPVLRLIDNLQVGVLTGTVAMQTATAANCTPFVYVFRSRDVVPDDIDATEPNPVVSVKVALDAVSGQYRYRVPFLEAGDYTASFTCDGAKDAPDADNVLAFSGTANVAIAANQTTTKDF